MSCPGRINLNMVLDRETAEARGEPTHFPCACERVAPKREASNLAAIRDTKIEAIDLLRAALDLFPTYASAETGPIEAVLRAALAQSVKLDGLIEDLWEAEGGA